MADRIPGAPERPRSSAGMSAAEKVLCEWEARHDVAARGRLVDPAAALNRYLTHSRMEECRRHSTSADRPEAPSSRRARSADGFAARHPLAAAWLGWGDDLR